MKRILVSGALANKPGNGGNAWTRLCWLSGLRQLGCDVTFVEQITPSSGLPRAVAFFDFTMRGAGWDGASALVSDDGNALWGMPGNELRRRARAADLLVNISGHLTIADLLQGPACRVYFDDDPGFTQFWHAQGYSRARLDGHDAYFTLGLNIGQRDCAIPTGAIRWRAMLPPVSLSDWPAQAPAPFNRFTTVAAWRGPYAPIQFGAKTYGLKAHEFRKFIELPGRTGLPFEIALNIDPADEKDEKALRARGWRLVDPSNVAGTAPQYREYIQRSGAEFSAAQGMYVETHSGWFSDRTARYLASGRPALVQDTGFSRHLPTGEGLVVFRTMDEAVEGAHRIVKDYARHARAARRLAEEHFDAARVLAPLLREVGLT